MFNNILHAFILCFIATFCFLKIGFAQKIPEKDLIDDYLQILSINGTIPYESMNGYPVNSHKLLDSLSQHPWQDRNVSLFGLFTIGAFSFAPYDLEMQNYWQSLEPGGGNDGAVWQGRGFTNSLIGGFFAEYGIVSVSIRPAIIYNQNRSFDLSPFEPPESRSAFADPFGNIDQPQRFGNGPFWQFDAGESYLRFDYKGWTTGISNETMWWGPARQNPIILSNNAPGFPHYFFGITDPKDIYVGYLKTKLFWGKLKESNYFDSNTENDERYITGGRIAFTPKPIPGLTVGLNRIFYETIPPEGVPAGNLLKIFEAFTKINLTDNTNPGGNDETDQMLSFFGRWIFPTSGLEVYGEWARNDHSWNWRDFITEPEHSRAYTFGLQKVFTLNNDRLLSMNLEATQLEASKSNEFRAQPSYYYHHRNIQGYTNRGQLLGASIGPGSNSIYLSGTYYFGKGKINMWGQRVAQNNDFLYNNDERIASQNNGIQSYWLHNIEMRFGAGVTYFYNRFEAGLDLNIRRELNDDYQYKKDLTHLGIKLSVRYRLSPLR